jgi:hypothetical protein
MDDGTVGYLAAIIHDELCGDGQKTISCPRWKGTGGHQGYYRQRAMVILDRLEPVIGSANVTTAVRVILSETD